MNLRCLANFSLASPSIGILFSWRPCLLAHSVYTDSVLLSDALHRSLQKTCQPRTIATFYGTTQAVQCALSPFCPVLLKNFFVVLWNPRLNEIHSELQKLRNGSTSSMSKQWAEVSRFCLRSYINTSMMFSLAVRRAMLISDRVFIRCERLVWRPAMLC